MCISRNKTPFVKDESTNRASSVISVHDLAELAALFAKLNKSSLGFLHVFKGKRTPLYSNANPRQLYVRRHSPRNTFSLRPFYTREM